MTIYKDEKLSIIIKMLIIKGIVYIISYILILKNNLNKRHMSQIFSFLIKI